MSSLPHHYAAQQHVTKRLGRAAQIGNLGPLVIYLSQEIAYNVAALFTSPRILTLSGS